MPIIVIPGISLRFEPPKVLVTEFLIAALLVSVILTRKFAFKRASRLLLFVITPLFLLSFFHLLLSPTEQNLFGNVFRLQGTILFWHFLLLAIITQNVYFSLKDKYIYIASFIAVCLGSLLYGSNSAGRFIGSLGEPNALGAVVVLIFPFVFLKFKSFWIRGIGLIAAIGVINFTQSRSGLVALGLELLFILMIRVLKERYFLASIICFSLLLAALTLPILERQYFLKTNTDPYAYRFEDRAEIWRVAANAGFKSPIIGSGLESIQNKIKETSQEMDVIIKHQTIDSSHNLLLDYWIWGGIVGLISILLLIIMTVKNLIKKKLLLELTVFIGLLTVLSFNPATVSILAAFWWVIGRSFAKAEEE